MSTYIDPTLSTASSDVPFNPVPQTGDPDTMERHFSTELQNVGSFAGGSEGNIVNSFPLTNNFTIECMIKTEAIAWQIPICKNGNPNQQKNGWWEPTFYVKFRADAGSHHIQCWFWDVNTNQVRLETTWDYNTNEWYRLAIVCENGSMASLYIMDESDTTYQLEATTIVARMTPKAGDDPEVSFKLRDSVLEIIQPEIDKHGFKFYLNGGPIINTSFIEIAQSDGGTFTPAVIVIALILLFGVFKIWSYIVKIF